MNIQIRRATIEDASAIQRLAVQLGYNPALETVLNGLKTTLSNPDYEPVVIVENETVLGWMNLVIRHRIEDVDFFQIAALVTEESRRGEGLGKKLVAYAETQAKAKGFAFVGLHSSKRRAQAHKFYENSGYQKAKESFFFEKNLV